LASDFFFRLFCPKSGVILVASPVIQTANSSLRWKNIQTCNLPGFWTDYQSSKQALNIQAKRPNFNSHSAAGQGGKWYLCFSHSNLSGRTNSK
jgi:hypothetical protein